MNDSKVYSIFNMKRSTIAQNRFSNLDILNIEKYIVVDVEDILNSFSKTERRIKLL
jgi:hypothetical protein